MTDNRCANSLEDKVLQPNVLAAARTVVRPERRLSERLAVHLEAECLTAGSTCRGLVISLSTKGAAFIAPQPFGRDTMFLLKIANGPGTVWHSRQARIIYLRPVSESDWVLGCHFDSPLADGEVLELLE
jgi:hypothetical protein